MTLGDWLVFLILAVEVLDFVVTRIEWYKEYQFDKSLFERKSRAIRKTKNNVRVVIEDGKANITEKPNDVNVTIEHKRDRDND